jgi:hypothetical protein
MQTVQTYPNLIEAQLAQNLLQSQGIEAFILEEGDSSIGISATLGQIHLRVKAENWEEAKKILDERGPFSGDKSDRVQE